MPITHSQTTATVGEAGWNDDHSVPTLAEVLVAGNDPDGVAIAAADDATPTYTGASLLIYPASPIDAFGSGFSLNGGNVPAGGGGLAAGSIDITSGQYDGGATSSVSVVGGQDGSPAGRVVIVSGGDQGTQGQVFVAVPPGLNLVPSAGWNTFLSTGSGAPSSTFSTLLYLDTDTTPGDLYAWNGSGYTLVSAGV